MIYLICYEFKTIGALKKNFSLKLRSHLLTNLTLLLFSDVKDFFLLANNPAFYR